MKTIKLAALPFTFIAAATLLGGCVGAEPIEGDEALDVQTEVRAEPEQTAESAVTLKDASFVNQSGVYGIVINGAQVEFHAYGDHLLVYDNASDGHSAVGQISGFGTCWNPNGYNTTVDCDYDTPESTISFRACIGEYGSKTLLACSAWRSVSAAN